MSRADRFRAKRRPGHRAAWAPRSASLLLEGVAGYALALLVGQDNDKHDRRGTGPIGCLRRAVSRLLDVVDDLILVEDSRGAVLDPTDEAVVAQRHRRRRGQG